eukprot:6201857-Pleurochrysis_carterae.AAC.1
MRLVCKHDAAEVCTSMHHCRNVNGPHARLLKCAASRIATYMHSFMHQVQNAHLHACLPKCSPRCVVQRARARRARGWSCAVTEFDAGSAQPPAPPLAACCPHPAGTRRAHARGRVKAKVYRAFCVFRALSPGGRPSFDPIFNRFRVEWR